MIVREDCNTEQSTNGSDSQRRLIGQDKVLIDVIVREDCNRTEQSTNRFVVCNRSGQSTNRCLSLTINRTQSTNRYVVREDCNRTYYKVLIDVIVREDYNRTEQSTNRV